MANIHLEDEISKQKYLDNCNNVTFNKEMIQAIEFISKNFWNKDIPWATFKIGQRVFFKHSLMCGYSTVIGINSIKEGVEYALKDIPFMLWEDEIQIPED